MDTSAVAEQLGTTPRKLRQFLRSDGSTFQAVGSGARYDFNESDLPALASRFASWSGTKVKPVTRAPAMSLGVTDKDRAVWNEELSETGPLILADIRNPAVRRKVRQIAREQERRLDARLLAVGLHISQMRVRSS